MQYLTTRVWKQLLDMLYNGESKTYGCIAWIMCGHALISVTIFYTATIDI